MDDDELTPAFVAAALRAREGGIDGIQLHAGHGYLFSSFLSPATNLRTDDYGGPLENRARYLIEVLTAVRAATGTDYPVGLRMSPDGPDDQTTVSDLVELTALLERDGLIDFVDISLGSHYRRVLLIGGAHLTAGYMLLSSERVTRATALPTMVAGRVTTLQQADDIVGSGAADLVAMVRATLAEPELIAKTISGRGAEVRPCIACLQSCAGGLNTRGRSMCAVNPAAGRELSLGDPVIRHATVSLRVIVVGGGPAGMEAASAATIAGHDVTLLEASDVLGGQLRLVPRARAEVGRLADYFADEMDLRGVDVRFGTPAEADTVLALEPDAVIVATGSGRVATVSSRCGPRRCQVSTRCPSTPGGTCCGTPSSVIPCSWSTISATTRRRMWRSV